MILFARHSLLARDRLRLMSCWLGGAWPHTVRSSTARPELTFSTARPELTFSTARPELTFSTARPELTFSTARPELTFTTVRPEPVEGP
jgi:hypothetical protein